MTKSKSKPKAPHSTSRKTSRPNFVIWERIEWALCAGLVVAYAVTYAIPAAF